MGRVRLALAAAVLLLSVGAAPAAAVGDVTFGTATATGSFGEDIVFSQPVTLTAVPERVELLITFADALGPTIFPIPAPGESGAQTLTYTMPLSGDGHLLPNTPLRYRWRVDGTASRETRFLYADDRFDWKTREGPIVRVHWYEGDTAFGQRALKIGEDAVEASSKLLGVTETEPVDFFIYARQGEFREALGPGTRENVGGQADSGIRTMFALITPGEIDDAWVGIVIPHELQHLVFNTAVDNPYHFPPRWLNEGLAVYQSESYPPGDRIDVEQAAKRGTLIPLPGLTGQFPTTADGFSLAYAESVSAVDFLVRTYGKDALVGLVRSYADGRTDDEAFTAAIGLDMEAFSDAWLADLDATIPAKLGPQPAPSGPVPSDWAGNATPSTAPSGGSADPSAGSASPSPTPAASGAPDPGAGGGGSPLGILGVLLLIGGAVTLIVGYQRQRSRR
jgi:Peptidase MA superfamily